jgi:thymidylate synthase ThyX
MSRRDSNIKSKVILDSVNRHNNRLTTMVVTMPKIILAEFNTHRMFSRNTSSSRAMPTKKVRDSVVNNTFIPSSIGANCKGMQSNVDLNEDMRLRFLDNWMLAANTMASIHEVMEKIGAHKQVCNRILEPWMYCTVIVTATHWANFFAQRCHKDADPSMMATAFKMLKAYVESTPVRRSAHIPFIESIPSWMPGEDKIKVSVARCARVSYTKHDYEHDIDGDIELYDKLIANKHMSPCEHVAKEFINDVFIGNFRGWVQHRKTIDGECINNINYEELLDSKPEWV